MAVKKDETKITARVFSCLSFIVALLLLVGGFVSWKMGSDIVSTVNEGLVAEKIYFPPAGSPGFEEAAFPDAQKYAGKQVDDGEKAKAYAEDFVGVQMELVGGGKTSSEVAAAVAADPTNPALQQQQAMMFQLGTTKTLLLLSGYATWTQGTMLKNAGAWMLVVSAVLLATSLVYWSRYKRS